MSVVLIPASATNMTGGFDGALRLMSGTCAVLTGDRARCSLFLQRLNEAGTWVDGRLEFPSPATTQEDERLRRVGVGVIGREPQRWPKLSALDTVAEPALLVGRRSASALAGARLLLSALGVPQRLWSAKPSTLPADLRRRLVVARGFSVDYPVLLLDDPLADIGPEGRDAALRLLRQAKRRGSVLFGALDEGAGRALADCFVAIDDLRDA